jgi:hypothetical protein
MLKLQLVLPITHFTNCPFYQLLILLIVLLPNTYFINYN